MDGEIGVRGVRKVKGMSDLSLDVVERGQVGGLLANDKVPHKIPQDLKKKKVNVEFV